MAKPGPPAKPTALRLLHGEKRPSRINRNEPLPAIREPEMPDWLSPHAQEVWERVTSELRVMGLLAGADQDSLAVYCQAVDSYVNAVKLVNTAGLVIRGRDGGVVKNPAVQMVRDFGATIRVMAGEFGLTPAARVGLSTNDHPSAGPGAERLLS